MLALTPQEQRILMFLSASLVVGSLVIMYKRWDPSRAADLVISEPELATPDTTRVPASPPRADPEVVRININTAPLDSLLLLPGIGPTLAARVIEYRKLTGGFERAEDLIKVKGIGKVKLEQIRGSIFVE